MISQLIYKNRSLITSLLLSVAFTSPLAAEPASQPLPKTANQSKSASHKIVALKPNQRLLHVKGMVCGMCVQGISKMLTAVEGVVGAEINLERGTVLVTIQADADVEDQLLTKAIARAGYEVQELHRPRSPQQSAQQK